eukprot:maker-scaffold25_size650667-snap-gene-4.15 protein:Tk06709 transcript:maker-scaffold25_size650667-snap-gene-4.15-mRNA-1 annotation:"hypothetical protein DAPPUDRAFT_328375"
MDHVVCAWRTLISLATTLPVIQMKMRRSVFLVILGAVCVLRPAQGATASCADNFLCTESFCSDQICAPICGLPETSECEGELLQLYDNPKDFCSCCPVRCVKYLKEGALCAKTSSNPFPTEMCGPQLVCDKLKPSDKVTTCIPGTTECLLALKEYEGKINDGTLGVNEGKPLCDTDGYWEPVQCIRGGLCHCVAKMSGMPIFGLAGGEGASTLLEQDCLCARSYYESLEQGCRMTLEYHMDSAQFQAQMNACMIKAQSASAWDNVYFPSHMRCLPNGNFDPIQCTERSVTEDMCFCINNDDMSINGTITYQSLITDLNCYDEEIHSFSYFNACEEKVHEVKVREKDFNKQGITFYQGSQLPKCSPDGFYDKVQVKPDNLTMLYCSDRQGLQIESFEAEMDSAEAQTMNCECAITRKYVSEGLAKPTCEPNGNFRPYQCQAGQCFCVDKYGRQTKKEVDQLHIDELGDCSEADGVDTFTNVQPQSFII